MDANEFGREVNVHELDCMGQTHVMFTGKYFEVLLCFFVILFFSLLLRACSPASVDWTAFAMFLPASLGQQTRARLTIAFQ